MVFQHLPTIWMYFLPIVNPWDNLPTSTGGFDSQVGPPGSENTDTVRPSKRYGDFGGGEVGGGAIYFWVWDVGDGGCWSWVELHWIEWFLPCHCIDLFKCPRSVPQKSSKRPGIWTLWTVSWYLMGRCDSKRPKFPWNSADGEVWAVIFRWFAVQEEGNKKRH